MKMLKLIVFSLIGMVITLLLSIKVNPIFSFGFAIITNLSLLQMNKIQNENIQRFKTAINESNLDSDFKNDILRRHGNVVKFTFSDYFIVISAYLTAALYTYVHLVYVQ